MSRIGNNRKAFTPLEIQKTGRKRKFLTGFTLIEIMVTTVIVSFTTVLIYEAFFRSLDLINYCSDYLKVVSWVDDKMWQAQNELTRFNSLTESPASGDITIDNKKFKWNLSYDIIDSAQFLYRLDLKCSWREGEKTRLISRMTYAMYREKEK